METVAASQSSKPLSAEPGLTLLCWWHLCLCLCGLQKLLERDKPFFSGGNSLTPLPAAEMGRKDCITQLTLGAVFQLVVRPEAFVCLCLGCIHQMFKHGWHLLFSNSFKYLFLWCVHNEPLHLVPPMSSFYKLGHGGPMQTPNMDDLHAFALSNPGTFVRSAATLMAMLAVTWSTMSQLEHVPSLHLCRMSP